MDAAEDIKIKGCVPIPSDDSTESHGERRTVALAFSAL